MSKSKYIGRHYSVYPIGALIDFLCLENQMEIANVHDRLNEARKQIVAFLEPNACFNAGKTKSIIGIAVLNVCLTSFYYFEEENRPLFHKKYNLIHDIGCVIDYLEYTRDYTRDESIIHALDVLIHSNETYFGKDEQISKDIDLFLRGRTPLLIRNSKK